MFDEQPGRTLAPPETACLVDHQTFGTRNVYHVNLAGVASLRDYFDALWERALNDYKAVAEDLYRKKRKEKN